MQAFTCTLLLLLCVCLPLYTEFLNRVDDMVVFNRLKREHMAPIVDIQLKEVMIANTNCVHILFNYLIFCAVCKANFFYSCIRTRAASCMRSNV
jgi:hypothetical protein